MENIDETQEEYQKLCDDLIDLLNGKSVDAVMPALALMLARAAIMGELPISALMAGTFGTFTKVYSEVENNLTALAPNEESIH
jgi:hypothetical protein